MRKSVLTMVASLLLGCGGELETAPSAEPRTNPQIEEGTAVTEGAVHGPPTQCVMAQETACILGTPAPARVLEVHYPNLAFCSIRLIPTRDLVFEQELAALAGELEVTLEDRSVMQTFSLPFSIKGNTLEFGLGPNTLYMTQVTVKTRSGRPLGAAIREKLNSDLVALPKHCVSGSN